MTREEAIESFKRSNKQAKVRLEVERMRMDTDEIKDLEFYIERNEMAIKALEHPEKNVIAIVPCGDSISRQAALSDEGLSEFHYYEDYVKMRNYLKSLPSVNPQEPKTDVLDKIRAEIEEIAKPNELGGRGNGKSIRYGLCMALEIIDKYKAESEDEE